MVRQRNTGIDLLRILAAFMVILLHILGQGGLLDALPSHSIRYKAAWSLEIMCYCAVNCFGLISGFVGWNSRSSWSGILRTWLQVLFYTVGASVILHFFIPDAVPLKAICKSFFPVLTTKYWYYTAYFCLSFFAPAMNHLIRTFPKQQLQLLCISGAILLSVIPTGINRDLFYSQYGYSIIWLMLLYMVGGYLSRYPVSKASSRKYICFYFISVAVTCLHKLYPDLFGPLKQMPFLQYTSPTILACAVSLLIFLSHCDFPGIIRSGIRFLAPLCFGTYLLHAQGIVYFNFMENRFGSLGQHHTILMLLDVFVIAALWFLMGVSIDYIRTKLFNRLNVPGLCKKLDLLQENLLSDTK